MSNKSKCSVVKLFDTRKEEKKRERERLTTMSEPLLEASLTAEGLLSTTRPPGTGVEVGGVGVGVAAEAVLAGWLDLGVGAGVTTDDVDTD